MRNKLSCYNRTLHIYFLRGTELIQSQINPFPRKTRIVVGLPKYINLFNTFTPARKSSVMIFTARQDVTFVRSLMLLSISLFFFPCCYYFFQRCFFNSVYHAHQAFAFRLRTCWYCACNWLRTTRRPLTRQEVQCSPTVRAQINITAGFVSWNGGKLERNSNNYW